MTISPDVRVEFHGTIDLVRPLTEAATAWLDEHIPEDAMEFGGAIVVEPRYLPAIVNGMIADGLVVNGG